MDTKTCNTCRQSKPVDSYYQKTYNYGKGVCYYGSCKKCVQDKQRATGRAYYINNTAKALAASRKWQVAHKDIMTKTAAKYVAARKRRDIYYDWAVYVRGHHSKYILHISSKELADIARKADSCAICGCQLNWAPGRKFSGLSPSLDRIDNGQDIAKDNIQIVCHSCNRTKSNRTMRDFVAYCKTVIERFESGM